MEKKKETFASLLTQFQYHFDLRPVFDDLLVMALTCLCLDSKTGKSHDEDLYMETIAKYAKSDLRHLFPKMFSALITEMEERTGSSVGNDVLGEFYQSSFYRKELSQYFTPWNLCQLMAGMTCGEKVNTNKNLRILDPCCGSGRLLLASSRVLGPLHYYYGIDVDMTCVRMAAINLFLNGVFHGEIMCADALNPDNFRVSYRFSLFPFGVFRITEKEKSPLWHLYRNSFRNEETTRQNDTQSDGSQLRFF